MFRVSLFLLVVVILLAACTPLEPTTTPETADFPTGIFSNGDRFLDLKNDGSFMLLDRDSPMASGEYVVTDDTFTACHRTITAMIICNPEDAEAIYNWAYVEDELTFEVVGEDNTRTEIDKVL